MIDCLKVWWRNKFYSIIHDEVTGAIRHAFSYYCEQLDNRPKDVRVMILGRTISNHTHMPPEVIQFIDGMQLKGQRGKIIRVQFCPQRMVGKGAQIIVFGGTIRCALVGQRVCNLMIGSCPMAITQDVCNVGATITVEIEVE